MRILGYLSFLGNGFGKKIQIIYRVEKHRCSSMIDSISAQRSISSFKPKVSRALKDKYGLPSFSPVSVSLLHRAKIWLFERYRYLGEMNYFRWNLAGKTVVLALTSYPGQVPEDKMFVNPRAHEPKHDLPWEVIYWIEANPSAH